jgi:peptidoglycan biosynthesis protein MviN/MurJ (putative lipid II flippase)
MSVPIAAAGVGLALTVVAAAALVPFLGVPGLGLASAIGITAMAVDLLRRLDDRVLEFDRRALALHLLKVAIAGAVAVGVARLAATLATAAVAQLAIALLVLVPLYLGLLRALKAEELDTLLRPARRLLRRR